LPEELEHGLQLVNPRARRIFREENSDLLTVRYWEDVRQKLLRGEIPGLRVYPDSCKLRADRGARSR
jgi:isocitrate dehydrogenase kinase/phosphatase